MMTSFLRRHGIIPAFDHEVIKRAEAEDLKVEGDKAFARLVSSSDLLRVTQGRLTSIIRESRRSTSQII